ncbi:MAG: sigma-70 family RNA polymerase sigma factor [Patescibacteria group bacterium]
MPRLFDSSKPDATSTLFNLGYRQRSLAVADERELILRAKRGDTKAMERLIAGNIGSMVKTARSIAGTTVPLEDALQECCVACIRAVQKFDPNRGARFNTYLTISLRSPLVTLKRQAPVIRSLSNTDRQTAHLISAAEKKLAHQLLRELTSADVAEELGVPEEVVVRIKRSLIPCDFLDDPEGLGSGRLTHANLPSRLMSPENATDAKLALQSLHDALTLAVRETLDQRSTDIITSHFLKTPSETHEQIGQRYGVTHQYISQLEVQALQKLRKYFRRSGLEPLLRDIAQLLDELRGQPDFETIETAVDELAAD